MKRPKTAAMVDLILPDYTQRDWDWLFDKLSKYRIDDEGLAFREDGTDGVLTVDADFEMLNRAIEDGILEARDIDGNGMIVSVAPTQTRNEASKKASMRIRKRAGEDTPVTLTTDQINQIAEILGLIAPVEEEVVEASEDEAVNPEDAVIDTEAVSADEDYVSKQSSRKRAEQGLVDNDLPVEDEDELIDRIAKKVAQILKAAENEDDEELSEETDETAEKDETDEQEADAVTEDPTDETVEDETDEEEADMTVESKRRPVRMAGFARTRTASASTETILL